MAKAYELCDYARILQETKHALCVVCDNEEHEISDIQL